MQRTSRASRGKGSRKERLKKLLYVYFNSHVLPDDPVFFSGRLGRGEDSSADVGRHEIELDRA